MKTAFLLAATAIVCSTSSVLAAQCSTTDITSIATLPEFQKLPAACGTSNFATATSADAVNSAFCKGDCIKAIEALSKVLPKCESSGVSLSATYDMVLKNCNAGSPAAAPAAAPVASAGVAMNGASAAVGAVAVVLAIARI